MERGKQIRNDKEKTEICKQGWNVPKSEVCGGLLRSSVEVLVMRMERKGQYTHVCNIVQFKHEEDMMEQAKPFVIIAVR